MNKMEFNRSDNSIDKSVARSSSGVSTQISADGMFIDKDSDCQILYGNLFSKFPHPEINVKSKVKNFTSQSFFSTTNDDSLRNDNANSMVSTVDRNLSISESKDRRFSDAHLRSFNKRKYGDKRASISNDSPASGSNVDKLLATLNDLQDYQPPSNHTDANGQVFRKQFFPSGEVQNPIQSKISLGDLQTTSLLDTLIQKAESSPKELFFTVLDSNSKIISNSSLTYSKLYQRAKRISCHITTKLNNVAEGLNVRPGQSVGLVFPADDVTDFVVGFFACLFSKVIAVPVEKPSISQTATSALTGKYLNQLGVSVILTNSSCLKEITRKDGDIKDFPQWKDLCWVTIDTYYHDKLSKNFAIPESCATFDAPLYVEYVYSDKHTLHGVPVSLESTLNHCQALKTMCRYAEGQSMLCTDDVRHQTGLWHCVLTALYCGMSSMFMPFSLVKKSPICWLNAITKHQIKFVVTSSRVLHHSLSIDKKELNGIDVSHLITLLVSDACVPWINETLDRFIQRFQGIGLQSESVLPCVCKSETLTICIRRRGDRDKIASSTLKLCLESLSYGLIKEISGDSNSMTSLESSGCLLPSMQAVVVQLDDSSKLCREDEIGEICVLSPFSNRTFWMTPDDVSAHYLSVNVHIPSATNDNESSIVTYTRTGLVGFFRVNDGMDNIYIHGSLINFIEISCRRINTDDIISTVSLVNPLGILHKARCCVFSVPILEENRLVIAVEVNADKYSEHKIYDWISNVLHAVLHLHQLNVYCVVGILPNTFPKTLLGDINVNDTMIRFMRGVLNISHLTICPQVAITNLPSPNRTTLHSRPSNPAAMLAHAMYSQSFASVSGINTPPMNKTTSLMEILEWRADHTPDHPLFSVINAKFVVTERVTCEQLHWKCKRIASLIKDKIKVPTVGAVVAIYLNNPLDLTYAIYACYYLGMVPLVLSMSGMDSPWLPFHLAENVWACKHSKSILCLTNGQTIRLLKSKEYSSQVPVDLWPPLVDISESPKKKPLSVYTMSYPEKQLAFIRLYIDQTGLATLPSWTHSNIGALCEAHKTQNDLAPGTEVALCVDMHTNVGIFLHTVSPVYCGHHSFIVSPTIMNSNPDTWLTFLSRKSIKHTFCSELALSQSVYVARFDETSSFSKKPGVNLQHLESLIVCASDRPNYTVIREFLAVFEDAKFGLQTLSIGIDSPWTMGLFVQIAKGSYPGTVYLEKLALRNCRIAENEGAVELAIQVLDLGQPVPNSTVLIVDCQSQCQKSVNQMGELWLSSEYTCKSIVATATPKHVDELYRDVLSVGRLVCDNDTCDVLVDNVLSAKLSFGQNIQNVYAKTGLLGFARSFGSDNQIVVLGRMDDVIAMRGFTYFPMEIEWCINQIDTDLINQSFVFAESDLLIAVIEVGELCKPESCFRLIPKLVKSVVESFLLPLGIIQFIKYGQISLNWHENRRRIKSLWVHRKIDSILQFYCL